MAQQPFIARGFRARSSRMVDAPRLPPGQYETNDFPVLSAGPTPRTPLSNWDFTIRDTDGHVVAMCDGGYATNLPLSDVTRGKAWVAFGYEGAELPPQHGGPARLLVPHLYFWKSAKWVRGLALRAEDDPGFWEGFGYHNYGDPWREQRYSGD